MMLLPRILLFLALFTVAEPVFAAPCRLETPLTEAQKGADYIPGVDVQGNAVVPADVQSGAPSLAYPIEIPITIDLLQRINPSVAATLGAGGKMEAAVARVKIHQDGRVEYNGRMIGNDPGILCDEIKPETAQKNQ